MANNPNLYGGGETSDDAQRGGKGTSKNEKRKMGEGGKSDPLVARYWREIERYERAAASWIEEGEQIVDVYLDENRTNSDTRKFAILWANVETLKPAVYVKPPSLVCSRRHKDKDPIGKVCADLMERATNTTFDLYNIDEVFRMVRDDRLLAGRGQAWVRYEAEIERYEAPAGTDAEGEMAGMEAEASDEAEPAMREKLKNEKVCADHVQWQDFGHNVAATWNEVWLAWRAVYKTRDECIDRFGEDVASRLSYTAKAPGSGSRADNKEEMDDRCKIYELWDKTRGLCSWAVKGERKFLESGMPPLNFRDFFPCPEPCYATKSTRSLIPRPDYRYYRDQAKEINDLTEKISRMSQWLIVKGFIPSGPSDIADPIEEALRDKTNSELFVNVPSMKGWADAGGAAKLIDWLPIEAIVKALQAAISARNQLIQDVFQLTGISDILRGQTDPNETLGAQELKAQTGSRRLRNTKDEIARFTRDIGRLMAEVIAEKFEPSTIAAMTGYKYIPPAPPPSMMQPSMGLPVANPMPQPGLIEPPQAALPMQGQIIPPGAPMPGMMQAMMGHNGGPGMEEEDADPELEFDDRHIALLRNDNLRNFRIDIETDSTIQADENAEKQSRVEFITAVGGYLEKATIILEKAPVLAPVLQQMLLFLARGFKTGKGLEDTLESGFKKLQAMLEQRAQQPNPAVAEAQAKAQVAEKTAQADAMLEANRQQTDATLRAHEQQTDATLETQKQQTHAQLQVRKQNLDASVAHRQIAQTASAQAQDRIAKAMMALKPTGPGSATTH